MCSVLGYLLGSEGMDGVRRRGGISKTVGIEDRPRHPRCRREGDVVVGAGCSLEDADSAKSSGAAVL